MNPTSGYAFAGTVSIPDQLAALTDAFDPFTRTSLDQIGIGEGWQVLEVGAGSGTIATYLADRVGGNGHVLATDLQPAMIPKHPAITATAHDIMCGDLPTNFYDLIHARLVLIHLPLREHILRRLLEALRPGGQLVLHEFDCTAPRPVLRGEPDAAALFHKVVDGINRVLDNAGARLDWGTAAHGALIGAGYTDVTTQMHAEGAHGGQPWARLGSINTIQLHGKLLDVGLTAVDLQAFRQLMDDPRFTAMSYLMTRTVGRRPA